MQLEQYVITDETGKKNVYYNTPFGKPVDIDNSPITVEEANAVFEALNIKVFQNTTDNEIFITLVDDEHVIRPRQCISIPNNLAYVARKIPELVEIPLIEIAYAVVHGKNEITDSIDKFNNDLERQREIRREARFLIAEKTTELFYKLKQIEQECLLDE